MHATASLLVLLSLSSTLLRGSDDNEENVPLTFVEPVTVDRVFVGEAAGDVFGWIARNAGDTDGDGVTDLWISAPYKNIDGANAGRCYCYSGKTGEELFRTEGLPGDQHGIGISGAGDVDGDGHADVVAGAIGAEGSGAIFIHSGKDGSVLLEAFGEGQGDQFGRKVAGAGDLDGDGHADIVVGAPGHDGPAGQDAGRAYVVSGADGTFLWTFDGERAGDNFGSTVGGHTGDSGRLVIIGAQNAGPGRRGQVHVHRIALVDGKPTPERAFVIEPEEDDVNLGRMFVSAVGDVNGDGTMDVWASDWDGNVGALQGAGRGYVHSGKDGSRLHTFLGSHAGEGLGIGTCEVGDADGDGADDLAIGSWQYRGGAQGGGRVTLYSGKTGKVLTTWTCSTPGETFGFDTTALGDLDGDGKLELLVTGAYSTERGPQSGRSYVLTIELPPRGE